ncbi:FK506-binding protein 4 [Cryptococcus amylolentus CBS 6039]|uniref:FK506-binding protein n=2 Tax=Cryptococcus amylolentus TaxID=104669 RepID=A0A1E3HZD2_9TREE|nr:FK506-binding protein 4 [Cryptococcus amylolentus CBS 6039]ODN81712.1 FK506-binding protein 4 [Cryptococcus amylolentus CBS 6039]ODO10086.1 FK506-binding protein 4 [Cryptococcus amylolentus CBS 6273]
MSIKMNLWSMTLLPGEAQPVYVRRDFQITNAALGEELRSTDGRSVVKVTHSPIDPAMFDDSDSEFDSDFDGEIDSDDEDDDEDMEEDEEKPAKKEKKVAAAEEEGDDEEDSEEDSDFEDELNETNVLCSLTAGKTEQASLNLTFVRGEVALFEVTGENAVHLMGNYINQDEYDSDDSDFEGDDDYSDIYDSEDLLESDDEEPTAKITEVEEPKPKKEVKAVEAKPAQKRKAEELESPAKTEATENLSKAQKKKLAKKAKTEADKPEEKAAAKPAAEKKAAAAPKKRVTASGLTIEDIKVGDGPAAKNGKRCGMRYIGKLTNGKQFDANTSGKPFSFVLGRGEVIKGWDEGLAGMNVGGERRLTIPPQLAYGNAKVGGIPKGSTLKFDVKLVSVQ